MGSSYGERVIDGTTDSKTGGEIAAAAIEPPLAETTETAETAEGGSAQNEQVTGPDDKALS